MIHTLYNVHLNTLIEINKNKIKKAFKLTHTHRSDVILISTYRSTQLKFPQIKIEPDKLHPPHPQF